MTLEEARRRVDGWMVRSYTVPSEETMTAIRVILAALPAPEKRTPGQTLGDAMYPGADYAAMRPYDKDAMEHCAIAVLKAHAVEFVLTDEAILAGIDAMTGYTIGCPNAVVAFRAAVKSRLDNDGDDRIRAGRTDRT